MSIALAFASPPAETPLESDLEEHSLVEAVVDWPFTIEAKKAAYRDECLNLRSGDIRVFEDGKPAETLGLRRAAKKTVHVLLIDTSRSMAGDRGASRRKLSQTKRASKYYVDLLARNERLRPSYEVMVLTFDDDLILRIPPTSIRDEKGVTEIRLAIDGIDRGYDTTFLDSLHRLVYYLGNYPDRFVLVVLSDGADNASLTSDHLVRRLIAEMNNLTIFAVGLGLPPGFHEDLLKDLAMVSGGEYYRVRAFRRPDHLENALRRRFEDMQDRLARQFYVSYLPPREDAGDQERLEDPDGDFLDVRIESSNDHCKVTDHKPQRFTDSPHRKPWKPASPAPSAEGPSGRVRLALKDILRDSGPLVETDANRGTPLTGPVVERRYAEIVLDPLDDKTGPTGTSPTGVVSRLARGDADETVARHLINGKVFHYYQHELARAVFESSPEHRKWLRARMEPEVREEYESTLPPWTTEEQFESVVRARLEQPTLGDLRRYLAAWLDDIAVRELGFMLEREWADDLLSSENPSGLEKDRALWKRLRAWFRPPERVRIVTPLVLAYDEHKQRFGYFRWVMPRLREMPEANFPDRATGLEALSWLLEHGPPESARKVREEWRVARVEHRVERVDPPEDGVPPEAVDRVTLVFDRIDSGELRTLEMLARWKDNGVVPQCYVPREKSSSGSPIDLARETIKACASDTESVPTR